MLLTVGSVVWKLATMSDVPMPEPITTPDPVAPPASESMPAGAVPTAPTASPTHSIPASSRTASELAPASLIGTEVDGAVTFHQGRVAPDIALRRLFDYFLSALGELSPAQIRTWLEAHVREQYGTSAVPELLDLFDRYVALLQAAERLQLAGLDQRERHTQIAMLRERLLGRDLAEAFYGAEDRYLRYTLDRIDVLRDKSLTASDRATRLETLAKALPAEERQLQNDSTLGVLVDEQTQQLDALGTDAAERFAEREALVGKAAAERLAALDGERAQWQQRVDRYKAARSAIQNDPNLDAATRTQRIQALLVSSFDEAERRRIESLQAIGQL
ncbi:MAG: hypothetical protein IPK97_12260 [Ahniella sp.]|nr:hypothetical protein [Ahniella sp.]